MSCYFRRQISSIRCRHSSFTIATKSRSSRVYKERHHRRLYNDRSIVNTDQRRMCAATISRTRLRGEAVCAIRCAKSSHFEGRRCVSFVTRAYDINNGKKEKYRSVRSNNLHNKTNRRLGPSPRKLRPILQQCGSGLCFSIDISR